MRTALAIVALTVLALAQVGGAQQYECTSATLVLGIDGSINATLNINVAAGGPTNLSIPTIGTPVYAEAYTPEDVMLAVALGDSWVNVSLPPGVNRFILTYITLDATAKTGEKWTLRYYLPCESRLILPVGAIPAGFSPEPRIVIENGSIVFVFPPGTVSVEYFIQPGQPQGPGSPGGASEENTRDSANNSSNMTSGIGEQGLGLGSAVLIVAALAVASAVVYYLSRNRLTRARTRVVEAEGLDERDERILEALRSSPEGLTASELIEITGIPKTPLYRRLNKLARRGLIVAVEEGGVRRYKLRS